MPQKRMISAAIWSDPDFYELTQRQQLLWLALITQADDQGRLRGDPAVVRSLCFPSTDMPLPDVSADLEQLASRGWLVRYTAKDRPYIQIVNWWKHQTMQWAGPSDHPAPDGWHDRMRYRKGERVITDNWQTQNEDTYKPRINAVRTEDDTARTCQADSITKNNQTKGSISEGKAQGAAPNPPQETPRRTIDHSAVPEIADLRMIHQAIQRGCDYQETEPIPTGKARDELRRILDEKRSPADVEACVRWLKSEEFWRDKPIPIRQVADSLPEWIRQGRPLQKITKPNGNGNGHSPPRTHLSDTLEYINQQIAEEHRKEATHDTT